MRSSFALGADAYWLISLTFITKREEHMVPNDLPRNCCDCQGIKACKKRSVFILTEHWRYCDHEGSAPRARPPLHFTEAESCVFPTIWVHGVQFLLVGQTCVRARLPYNREFTKPRRQRQRERHQTKGLMSRTMAVHVRYKSWYISLPSSANQQREKTKFCVVWRT